ncbi:hypothetical protein P3L10_000832 [Capsicum annuum]
MPSLGVLSASHDGSIRLWELSGQVLLEMVGHTAIVYSVDAHASGLIVSGSEGRFAKIWKVLVKTGLMMAYHVLFLMEFNMIMCLMIDIGDGEPVRKLPYNRSDIIRMTLLKKWLLKENLSLSYREQVVEFIHSSKYWSETVYS